MCGSGKNGKCGVVIMYPSSVTGPCLPIRDGFGSRGIGRVSTGVSTGSVVIGRVVNGSEILKNGIKKQSLGQSPGLIHADPRCRGLPGSARFDLVEMDPGGECLLQSKF